jgi:hypothetical protein
MLGTGPEGRFEAYVYTVERKSGQYEQKIFSALDTLLRSLPAPKGFALEINEPEPVISTGGNSPQ